MDKHFWKEVLGTALGVALATVIVVPATAWAMSKLPVKVGG